MEEEDKLNRGQIIRFFLDYSRKMEKMWELMQEMVANMTLEGFKACGTKVVDDHATPVRVTTTLEAVGPLVTTPEGSGGPSNLIGTPDLTSPTSWSDFSSLSTKMPQAWKSAMPEGLS